MGGVGGEAALLTAGPDRVVQLQPLQENLAGPEAEAGTDLDGGTAGTEEDAVTQAGSGEAGQGGVKVKTVSAASCHPSAIFFIKIFQQFQQWLYFDPFLILLEILNPSSL